MCIIQIAHLAVIYWEVFLNLIEKHNKIERKNIFYINFYIINVYQYWE